MKTNVKTRSGNRIVVVFDGIQLGLVRSVRANDDYSPEPASESCRPGPSRAMAAGPE